MANIKITELNAAGSLAATDVVPVVDVSADETKKITTTNLFRTLPDGTAAAPALAFSSDQANGVYLAGTDTVGISTGGTQRFTVDGSGNVTISGDLTVNGATTTVESTIVTIDDHNIELGSVASPSNTTADGGGITLKGATDKEIKWVNSTGYWTFNTGIEVGGHVQLDDSNEIRFGNNQDLQIYHDGTHSHIRETGTGNLRIRSSKIQLMNTNSEPYFTGTSDGPVQIYHDNVEKFKTKVDGIRVTGEVQCDSLDVDGAVDIDGSSVIYDSSNGLKLADSVQLRFGGGNDLRIYHDGSNSYIDDAGTGVLNIRSNDIRLGKYTGELGLQIIADGETRLHYDNLVKLATKTGGIDVTGEVQCDFLDVDGGVDIDGGQVFYDATNNVLKFADNAQLRFGAGNDFRLYHNGTNNQVDNYTGTLFINQYVDDADIILRSDNGSGGITNYIQCDGSSGATKLFHYGSEKLQTKSDGILVQGEVQSDSLDVNGAADISGDISISGGNKTVQTTAGFLQVGTSGSNHLAFITNGNERGRVDSSGRLMLGTTTEGYPDADNFTLADSGHCGITIRSGATSAGAIYFSDGTSGNAEYRGYFLYDHDGDHLRFGTAAAERLRILSTGAWSIEGANNYGTSGQVLTSNGNDAPTWQDAGAASVGGANAISMNDNVKINFGGGNDLQIYHSGSHSYIKDAGQGNLYIASNRIEFRNAADNESLANFIQDGAIELYYDNSKKFETKSDGVSVFGQVSCNDLNVAGELNMMGSSDGAKYLDVRLGSNTFNIRGTSGGDTGHETLAQFTRNGPVKLYYDNVQKLQTKTDGVDITGELQCDSLDVDGGGDFTGGVNFRGGVGAVDVKANSDIRFENGNWTGNSTSPKIQGHGNALYIAGGNNGIIFRENGTDRCQIDASGHLKPSQNNTYDLGTSSLRWRNIYTNDLNLSNEGSSNDVDGTWGNYTIQEGEDDLFLINRRNGKKYKFNLTEVS